MMDENMPIVDGKEYQGHSAKNKLIKGFRELVVKKSFEKLTVSQICETAQVSRKTFYSYFKDKNDVIEHILLKSLIQPFEELRKLYAAHDDLPVALTMEWLYRQVYEDRDFYAGISSFTGQNSLQEFILKHNIEMLSQSLASIDMPQEDKEYTVYFYAASHTMLLIKWIRDGMVVSPKKMASYYEKWTIPVWRDISQNKKR